jgi:hypothetical protein
MTLGKRVLERGFFRKKNKRIIFIKKMIAVPRKKTHEQNNNVDFENIIPQSSLFVSRCASLAPRAGIEPATVSLEGCCSIH